MKILIMGTGAVGGYFGARLAKAGNNVIFVARGKHLDAIREKGLRVDSPDGDLLLKVRALEDPAEAGFVDLVFLAVKNYQLALALGQLTPCVGRETMILTVQNGVSAEELAIESFGKGRVLGGVAYIGSRVEGPGHIVHSTLGRIALGELHDGTSPRLRELEKMFFEARIPVTLSDDIMVTKWRKLVWNTAFNAVSVLTRMKTRAMAESVALRPVLINLMEEVIAVARAEGHSLDREVILSKTFELTRSLDDVETSMLQDFEKGRKLEIEGLNGVVVQKGKERGVPTPVNEMVVGLLRGLEERREIR